MPERLGWRTLLSYLFLLTIPTSCPQLSRAADQQSSSSQAQPSVYQSSTVLRATTRLVVVDVVATDSKGEPVPDLKAEDFTVLEDGKPQKVSGFTFQRGNTATLVASSGNTGGVRHAPTNTKTKTMKEIPFDAPHEGFRSPRPGRGRVCKVL